MDFSCEIVVIRQCSLFGVRNSPRHTESASQVKLRTVSTLEDLKDLNDIPIGVFDL